MLWATSPGIQCLLHLKGTAGVQQIPTRKSHHFLPSQKTTRWKTEKYSFPIGYFLILQGTEPCYESFHNKVKWKKNISKESKNLPACVVDFKKASKTRFAEELLQTHPIARKLCHSYSPVWNNYRKLKTFSMCVCTGRDMGSSADRGSLSYPGFSPWPPLLCLVFSWWRLHTEGEVEESVSQNDWGKESSGIWGSCNKSHVETKQFYLLFKLQLIKISILFFCLYASIFSITV